MTQINIMLYLFVFAVAIFLLGGGPALVNMLINGISLSEPYPQLLALTPIALFLISIGVMGAYMLVLYPANAKNHNGGLAKKQFFVGFTMLFLCYIGLELLLGLGLQ